VGRGQKGWEGERNGGKTGEGYEKGGEETELDTPNFDNTSAPLK